SGQRPHPIPQGQDRARGAGAGDDPADPAVHAADHGRLSDLPAGIAAGRSGRLGRHLPPQGGVDPPGQRGDRAGPHQRRAAQRAAGPGAERAMASKADIDQDALAAEWGLALEAEESGGPAPAPAIAAAPAAAPGDGNDEMAAQWAAMIDDGSQFVQAAKGGAERILN